MKATITVDFEVDGIATIEEIEEVFLQKLPMGVMLSQDNGFNENPDSFAILPNSFEVAIVE